MRSIVALCLCLVLGVASTPASALASKRGVPRRATVAQGATVTGETKTAAGAPLSNQHVRLRNVQTGKVVDETSSDDKGSFLFADVAPGEYIVEMVNAAGQVIGVSAVITVTAGSSVVATIAATASGLAAAAGGGISLFGLGTTTSAAVLAAAGAVAATAVVVTRREASVSR